MGKKRGLTDDAVASTSKRRHTSEKALSQSQSSQSSSIQEDAGESSNTNLIRSGKLIRMRLINFMCHENLVIDFNSRVNLLVGNNGSGKSAILTALVVGLGSAAKVAHRAKNIKQLIKSGENSATIEIEISNGSWDGYDREQFGNKIIIVRNISMNGASHYKIKNEYGQVIYKNTDNLNKILLYHNIQVDNPAFVLNQDNARSFLRDLDPSKNYQLFLKATQIETIQSKINECVHMFRDYKYRFDCLKKKSNILKEEFNELQHKYDQLRSAEKLQETLKQYNLEKVWLDVANQEITVEELQAVINEISTKQQKLLRLVEIKQSIELEFNKEFKKIDEELEILNKKFCDENRKLEILKNLFNKENEKIQIEESELKKLKENIHDLEKNIELLKANIAERSHSTTSYINKLRETHEMKKRELQQKINDIQAMISNTKRDIEITSGTRIQHEEQFEDLKYQRQQTIQTSENIQRELIRMKSRDKNILSVYGEHTKRLLESIQRAYESGKFTEMPRGPVGRYIQVVNQKWRGVVEYFLSGCINLFLVNSANDRKVLDQILSTEFPGVKERIVTNQFHHQVYNIENGKVHAPKGSHLLMDEIKCKDPVVMNCLIDRAHIETILLVENQELAVQLTSDSENIPKHLHKVILLDPLIEYFPLPTFRAYSLKAREPRFLQVNVKQRINQLESAVVSANKQKEKIEEKLMELKKTIEDTYKRENQIRTSLDQHEKSRKSVIASLEELQNYEYPSQDELGILESELRQLESNKESCLKNLDEKKNALEACLIERKNYEKEYERQKLSLESINEEIESLKTEHENKRQQLHLKLDEISRWTHQNEQIAKQLETTKEKYNKELQCLKSLTEKAETEGERVETQRTKDELIDLIRGIERKIMIKGSIQESIEELEELLRDKGDKLQESKTLTKTLANVLNLMNTSREERFKFVKSLKEHMAIRIRYNFDKTLSVRHFKGNIDVNHSEMKLTVTVIPRVEGTGKTVSNTKSLSGGERSFSTVAFLISLWSCVDHPFYMLDEYDVFTDQVNRQLMTKLLLIEANSNPKGQYTLLTPQDMSFIEPSDTITIHRLSNPRQE